MDREARTAVRVFLIVVAGAVIVTAQNRIDVVSPMAPELASYGPRPVGVRTLVVTDHDRVDVLRTTPGGPIVRGDRPLTLEVWYPAAASSSDPATHQYRAVLRDPTVTVTLTGRATRDAAPSPAGAPFPLVVISHGYPGNRYLMSHLGENLASKGYVVASIDHADSTYDDLKAFASTLYNRPLDQRFAVDAVAALGAAGSGSVLSGLVDADHTAIIGYSMGGYGVLNVIGGAYRQAAASFTAAPRSPSVPGGCPPGSGTRRAWPASVRQCCSWPAAPTTSPATRRAREPSSPPRSMRTAISSPT